MTKYLRNSTHPSFVNNGAAINKARYDETISELYDESTTVFNSLSDLIGLAGDLSKFTKNKPASVLGFSSFGDGGHGLFYYDSTKAKSDHNGGTIINNDHNSSIGSDNWYSSTGDGTDDTGTGCWIRLNQRYVSILSFGCKADGATDNTVSGQKAIDVSYGREWGLYIPDGDYIANWTILSETTIVGEGRGSKIIPQDGTTPTLRVISEPNENNGQITTGHIEKLNITGDRDNTSKAIYFYAETPQVVTNFTMRDIWIDGCYDGLYLESGTAAGEVYQCNFENFHIRACKNDGLNIDTGQCRFMGYRVDQKQVSTDKGGAIIAGTNNTFYDTYWHDKVVINGQYNRMYQTRFEKVSDGLDFAVEMLGNNNAMYGITIQDCDIIRGIRFSNSGNSAYDIYEFNSTLDYLMSGPGTTGTDATIINSNINADFKINQYWTESELISDNINIHNCFNETFFSDAYGYNRQFQYLATANRPGTPFTGQQIFDTDVGGVIVYNGTGWERRSDGTSV